MSCIINAALCLQFAFCYQAKYLVLLQMENIWIWVRLAFMQAFMALKVNALFTCCTGFPFWFSIPTFMVQTYTQVHQHGKLKSIAANVHIWWPSIYRLHLSTATHTSHGTHHISYPNRYFHIKNSSMLCAITHGARIDWTVCSFYAKNILMEEV